LQPAADHHEVAGPQQLGDGRVAELLAELLVVGSAKPCPQREHRAGARLGQGEGDPGAAAADRRRADELAAQPHAVGEGGRDRFPDALLEVGDAEGRLVGAVGGDQPGGWEGAPGGLIGHEAGRRFLRNRHSAANFIGCEYAMGCV
jgi:hypothetical protein